MFCWMVELPDDIQMNGQQNIKISTIRILVGKKYIFEGIFFYPSLFFTAIKQWKNSSTDWPHIEDTHKLLINE